MNRNSHAFTIVELLIVIVVIAILAAISVVAYAGVQERAKKSTVVFGANQVKKAIQAEAVLDGSGVVVETPVGYASRAGITPLVDPLERVQEITMYTVFETNGDLTDDWKIFSHLRPGPFADNRLQLRVHGAGTTAAGGTWSTTSQTDRSLQFAGIRNTTGRQVGWISVAPGQGSVGFNDKVGVSAPLLPHDGWSFSELQMADRVGWRGLVTIVFPEYHDEVTRAVVLKWLAGEYDISHYPRT